MQDGLGIITVEESLIIGPFITQFCILAKHPKRLVMQVVGRLKAVF
jgi:hypothetical protein